MNPSKQTLQTYIKTLHAKGASKDYELASVMKKVEEMESTYAESQQNTTLATNEISFYNDWMLDEIEVIKPDTMNLNFPVEQQ